MAALPYIQLYVAEYLADTAHLTCEEHGAYLLLIFNYWQRGKALDNSNGRLSNVVHLSNERWTNVSETLHEFFTVVGDTWTHARIERDLKDVNKKCEQARLARSQRKSNGRKTDVATDDQQPSNDKKRIEEIKKEEKREVIELPAWLTQESWESYQKVRKSQKKSFVDNDAKRKWIRSMQKHYDEGYDVAEMLDQMIANNWLGIVDEKWKKRKIERRALTDEEAAAQWEKDFALMGMPPNA